MIARQALPTVVHALSRQAVVALIGPRQVGKTTLTLAIAQTPPSLYLDLEDREDRSKLADPALLLSARADLQPARCFVVYSGTANYPLAEGIEAISLRALAELLSSLPS